MFTYRFIFLTIICSADNWISDLDSWRRFLEPRGYIHEALELNNGPFGRGVFTKQNVTLCYLHDDTIETCDEFLRAKQLLLHVPPDKIISPENAIKVGQLL